MRGGSALRLLVPARPDQLFAVREALWEWLSGTAISAEKSFDLLLAANEAVANVVAHAYESGSGVAEIEARVADGSVVIRVGDNGRWRPGDVTEGGRGYPMMHALVDSVEVSRTSSGTQVWLRQPLLPVEET